MSNNRFFQPSANAEEDTSSSQLSKYLRRDDIQQKLKENAERYLTQSLESDGQLSRYFNDLPQHYDGVQPLVDTVEEAVTNENKMGIWLDLVITFGMKELFDRGGNIHPEIYQSLNYKTSPDQPGILDSLIKKFGEASVKSKLLCAYVTGLVCSKTSEMISLMKHDIIDELKSPYFIYSHALNSRLKMILDQTHPTLQDTIRYVIHDLNSRSIALNNFIKNQIGNPADIPYSIFSFIGNKLENIRKTLSQVTVGKEEEKHQIKP